MCCCCLGCEHALLSPAPIPIAEESALAVFTIYESNGVKLHSKEIKTWLRKSLRPCLILMMKTRTNQASFSLKLNVAADIKAAVAKAKESKR